MGLLSSFQRNDLLAISSLLVAASSFCVSYLSYKRDQGRLDVKIGIWQEVNLQTGVKNGDFIRISIVNSGRRPVVVDSIGAFPRWQRIKRFLHEIYPKRFTPVGFFIADPLVMNALIDSSTGKYRVMKEGESMQVAIPLPKIIHSKTKWLEMHEFYVSDTTGCEYYCKRKVLKTFVEALSRYGMS